MTFNEAIKANKDEIKSLKKQIESLDKETDVDECNRIYKRIHLLTIQIELARGLLK